MDWCANKASNHDGLHVNKRDRGNGQVVFWLGSNPALVSNAGCRAALSTMAVPKVLMRAAGGASKEALTQRKTLRTVSILMGIIALATLHTILQCHKFRFKIDVIPLLKQCLGLLACPYINHGIDGYSQAGPVIGVMVGQQFGHGHLAVEIAWFDALCRQHTIGDVA